MLRVLLTAVLLFCTTTVFAAHDVVVVVVLDDSGSMDTDYGNESRMEAAKSALVRVVNSLPKNSALGVYCINARWTIPLSGLNKQRAIADINTIGPTGGTPLGAALKVGGDALIKWRKDHRYGSYHLLIITDGEEGDKHLTNQYTPDLISRGFINVNCIGVDMDDSHTLATILPEGNYQTADSAQALNEAITNALAEVTSKDAAEDFEMLNAITADQATAILAALSKVSDHPVGEEPVRMAVIDEETGQIVVDENGNVETKEIETGTGVGRIVLTVIIVLAVIFCLFLFIR